jgi:TRAP-type C4-dicarboxylate transport system permease small subunit
VKRRNIDDWGLLGLGLVALIATVLGTLAVVSRYMFSLPLSFSDEIVTYLVVWSLLVAIGLGERENIHIRATVITERLSPATQLWLARATLVLTLAFAAVMIWYGGQITLQRYGLKEVSPTILQFPQWVARLCIPVGFALVALAALLHLKRPTEAKTETVS